MANEPIELGVSDLVALLNQTLDYAYPSVIVTGELANMRVSKGKWLYFDVKDELSSVKFFGTVYQLPGPLEDGMMVRVVASPRLHNKFGFSMNVQSITAAGEGSIKKAQALLQAKLQAEGLFDDSRKRPIPAMPRRIGLVASAESAAYADFMKVMNARFTGVVVSHIDVQVQGQAAPAQIAAAVQQFSVLAEAPEVIVVIRGGGSAEDLAAFSTELVARAVACSRIPTAVAIGHEVDISLAELAADLHASTPSNAAELLFPDKAQLLRELAAVRAQYNTLLGEQVRIKTKRVHDVASRVTELAAQAVMRHKHALDGRRQLLAAYNPAHVLARGYALITNKNGKVVSSTTDVVPGDMLTITVSDGTLTATVGK